VAGVVLVGAKGFSFRSAPVGPPFHAEGVVGVVAPRGEVVIPPGTSFRSSKTSSNGSAECPPFPGVTVAMEAAPPSTLVPRGVEACNPTAGSPGGEEGENQECAGFAVFVFGRYASVIYIYNTDISFGPSSNQCVIVSRTYLDGSSPETGRWRWSLPKRARTPMCAGIQRPEGKEIKSYIGVSRWD